MRNVQNILADFIAGTLCAIGGAWKDTPHEGFKPLTFPRSIVVGTFGSFVSALVGVDSFVIALCVAGYFERAAVEGWKIVRGKKPGKFDWA